jgi:hypothetical protein
MPTWDEIRENPGQFLECEDGLEDFTLEDPAAMDRNLVLQLTLMIIARQSQPEPKLLISFRDQASTYEITFACKMRISLFYIIQLIQV